MRFRAHETIEIHWHGHPSGELGEFFKYLGNGTALVEPFCTPGGRRVVPLSWLTHKTREVVR